MSPEETQILLNYAHGKISKEEAMIVLGYKKATFNSRMRSLGFSSESHYFPRNSFKPLVPKNDKEYWENIHNDYKSGESIESLSSKLGIKPNTIKERFNLFNLELRKESENRKLAIEKMRSTTKKLYGVEYAQQSDEIKKATQITVKEKYCVDNVAQFVDSRVKISQSVSATSEEALVKRKETNLCRYGFNFAQQDPEVKQKILNTNIERYGTAHAASSNIVRSKIQNTNKVRYGSESPLSNQEVIQKRVATITDKKYAEVLKTLDFFNYALLDEYKGIFTKDGFTKGYKQYKIKHLDCGLEFYDDLYLTPRCRKCFPLVGNKRGQLEIALASYIESLGFNVQCNTKDVIKNTSTGKWFEIDIYIESKKLAFEIDSLYHHSTHSLQWGKPVEKNYHLNKTQSATKEGIRLIHLWEDWSLLKIQSVIKSELGILDKKNARSLKIKEIDCSKFFDETHVYGKAQAIAQFALVDEKDEIQCAMSFRNHPEGLEISRFSSRLGTSVRGGFSRLLKHAMKTLKWHTIISYCDRDLSPVAENTVYFKNGFELVEDTGPRLFYTNFRRRWSREAFQKHKIKSFFPESFNSNLTADQILSSKGIYSIWNSGNWKFKITK
jgi:hypothetical protein